MSEQKEKRTPNPVTGIILIILGVLGIITRVFVESDWNILVIIKFLISLATLAAGLWIVFKKKN